MRKKRTPVSDAAIKTDWPAFVTMLAARLDKGRQTYGDGSFSKDPLELTEELKQEVLDIAGWGFILWRRLREIERALEDANPSSK